MVFNSLKTVKIVKKPAEFNKNSFEKFNGHTSNCYYVSHADNNKMSEAVLIPLKNS